METQQSVAIIDEEEQEYEFISELEKDWRKSLPRLSDIEWLELFPEAREVLPYKIKEWCDERKRLVYIAKRFLHEGMSKNALEIRLVLQVFVLPPINEAEKHVQRLRRQTVCHTDPVGGRITEINIQRGREVPIASLISSKIRCTGKTSITNCPLHEDRSPSFVIYHETNSFWCFGCQKGGDSIALVRLLHNLSFVEAVEYLKHI